jgi:hypothetical protein
VLPFTYLAGRRRYVTTEWSNAFTAQSSDAMGGAVSSDPSIHAMADAHVAFMSTVGRMERRAICGTPPLGQGSTATGPA